MSKSSISVRNNNNNNNTTNKGQLSLVVLVFVSCYLFSMLCILLMLMPTTGLASSSSSSSSTDGSSNTPLLLDFTKLITELRGDDVRLFRYDASDHTISKQSDDTLCGKDIMDSSMKLIVDTSNNNNNDLAVVAKALEYITLCVTDNPTKRSIFASYNGIHEAVIGLIEQQLPYLSSEKTPTPTTVDNAKHAIAMAAHVIYITTFANVINHQTYIKKGAVQQLMNAIKATVTKTEMVADIDNDGELEEIFDMKYPYVTMWSCAALSNLAASYCDTPSDGRCYWEWTDTGLDVVADTLPILSDGQVARENILQDISLIQLLADLSCQGPVSTGEDNEEEGNSREVIMAGETAQINRDESSTNLIPWAAASALKNIAIDPKSHEYLEQAINCFCYLSNSNDWLEVDKGESVLKHLRRGNPCWFSRAYTQDEKFVGNTLCIDHVFYHAEGYTCSDYDPEEEPTDADCAVIDRDGVSASSACCACGGGFTIVDAADDGYEDEL